MREHALRGLVFVSTRPVHSCVNPFCEPVRWHRCASLTSPRRRQKGPSSRARSDRAWQGPTRTSACRLVMQASAPSPAFLVRWYLPVPVGFAMLQYQVGRRWYRLGLFAETSALRGTVPAPTLEKIRGNFRRVACSALDPPPHPAPLSSARRRRRSTVTWTWRRAGTGTCSPSGGRPPTSTPCFPPTSLILSRYFSGALLEGCWSALVGLPWYFRVFFRACISLVCPRSTVVSRSQLGKCVNNVFEVPHLCQVQCRLVRAVCTEHAPVLRACSAYWPACDVVLAMHFFSGQRVSTPVEKRRPASVSIPPFPQSLRVAMCACGVCLRREPGG